MAEETIVIEATSHSGQVETDSLRSPQAPASAPQAPLVTNAPPVATVNLPAPAIAPRTDTHSDQVEKVVNDEIQKGKAWFDSLSDGEKLATYYELLDKGVIKV